MKKIFLLSKMLSCGGGEGNKKSDQNADVINIFFIVVLAVASFSAGMFLTPLSCKLIPNETIAALLVVVAALLSLIRVFPMIINGLFMSKDVEVLLTLPYSPLQLALSNCINIVKTIGLYQIAASFPFAIGLFIAETGDIVNILIMDIMFVIFVPIFVAFFIILLATLIMKGLKTMANKEFQKILGVVFIAILLIGWCIFSFNNNASSALQVDILLDTINKFSSFVWIVPVAAMIRDFVHDGNILNLLYVLLIDGGLVALSFLALNAFYLKILMQVSNTFGSGKTVSDKSIKDASKKSSIMTAIVKKDLKLIFRDSGYYLNCIIQPLILVAIMFFAFYQLIDKLVVSGMKMSPDAIVGSPIAISVSFGISIGAIAASCLVALSGVAACSISREGHSYIFLKQMPLNYQSQLKAKRNVALWMSVPLGLLVVVGFSVFGIVIGAFNWLALIAALIVFLGASIFFINYSILVDLAKPSLYDIKMNKLTSPKSSTVIAGLIISIASLVLPFPAMLSPMLAGFAHMSSDMMNIIIYVVIAVLVILPVVLAFVFEKRMKSKGPILFNKL